MLNRKCGLGLLRSASSSLCASSSRACALAAASARARRPARQAVKPPAAAQHIIIMNRACQMNEAFSARLAAAGPLHSQMRP
ncbi:MAG: hypothetical protein RL227_1961 [Pseudomonadota bacterium]